MERSSRDLVGLTQELSGIGLEDSSKTELDHEPTQGRTDNKIGFLDILDVATKFEIPYTGLNFVGIPTSSSDGKRQVQIQHEYTVGSGYSSRVARHVTQSDLGCTRESTMVAIKQFISKPPETGKSQVDMDALMFRAARREIKALCHPSLKQHENICDILYVGWKNDSSYPFIAMELATYGTLEDVLTASGIGPSRLQKMNICIDVILAVEAIHSSGMIHGDIKPLNIIIQHHGERQLVAKMIDLAGSSDLLDDSGDNFRPRMGTELWSAPEICVKNSSIDWFAADVYSLGLVIASIWARPPVWFAKKRSSSCILDAHLPQVLNATERAHRLTIIKTHTDLHPHSVLQLSLSEKPGIRSILSACLSAIPTQRHSASELAKTAVLSLSGDTNRVSHLSSQEGTSSSIQPGGKFRVWDEWFLVSDPDFHKLVYNHLIGDSRPISQLIDDSFLSMLLKNDFAQGNVVQNSLLVMQELLRACQQKLGQDSPLLGRLAYNIAISHCLELGTIYDNKILTDSIYASALAGYEDAMVQAPLLGNVTSSESEVFDKLRLLFLIIGVLLGAGSSVNTLKKTSPEVWSNLRQTLQDSPGILQEPALSSQPLLARLESIRECLLDTKSTYTLFEALRCFDSPRASEILNAVAYDASLLDKAGMGVFHYLTYLDDEQAAALAKISYQRGAELTHKYYRASSSCLISSSIPESGTPLSWAWAFGMHRYFGELLGLHMEHNVPVADYRLLLKACIEQSTPRFLKKLLLFNQEHPNLANPEQALCIESALSHYYDDTQSSKEKAIKTSRNLSRSTISELIEVSTIWCISNHGVESFVVVQRRARHGSWASASTAQTATLQILLENGANLTLGLQEAIESQSASSVDAICRYIKFTNTKEEHLGRLFVSLIRSIWGVGGKNRGSFDCFSAILSHFPQLITFVSPNGSEMLTPLCAAAHVKDPRFAKLILGLGADVRKEYENFSPLSRALSSANIETANVIYEHLSESERLQECGANQTGYTLTGRVLMQWRRDRNLGLLEVLAWLGEHESLVGQGHVPDNTPAWSLIMSQKTSFFSKHIQNDILLIEKLFQLKPEYLQDADSRGFLPIHQAAYNGLFSLLKSFVDMGVDINLETREAEGSNSSGKTALDIATWRLFGDNTPEETIEGGATHIAQWRELFQNMVLYLRANNARSGSRATDREMMAAVLPINSAEHQYHIEKYRPENYNEEEKRSKTGTEIGQHLLALTAQALLQKRYTILNFGRR